MASQGARINTGLLVRYSSLKYLRKQKHPKKKIYISAMAAR
jgi:hypothetical protein